MVFGFSRRNELPSSPQMRFTEVIPGYTCRWAQNELEQFVPSVVLPDESYVSFKGVFGRIVEYGSDIRCYQYIFLWDGQLFPPHPMDYEPVLVFVFDRLDSKAVLYDYFDYKIGKYWIRLSTDARLRVVYPWHSFRRGRYFSDELEVQPLTDDHLNHWWNISDPRAKFTIDDDIRHPIRLLGSNDIRNKQIPHLEMLAAWAKLPFLAYARMARDLGGCLMTLFNEVVQNARIRLRNPGYERIAAGYLVLLKILEDYKLINLEPSIKGYFSEVEEYDSKFSRRRFIKAYAYELDNWEPDTISSTETGVVYFTALKNAVTRDRILSGTLTRWLNSFKKRIST